LHNKKKFAEAILEYKEALSGVDVDCTLEEKKRLVHEIHIPCLINMAASLKEKKEFAIALRMCDKALELNKEYFKTYYRIGSIHLAKGDIDEAMKNFKLADDYCLDENSH